MNREFYSLMGKLDDYSHPWLQMTSMNNPSVTAKANGWQERILSELKYLNELTVFGYGKFGDLLDEISLELQDTLNKNGALIREDCLAAEKRLEKAGSAAKSLTAHMVSHAHIDMNWLWGWHETVSVTIDTFRTMLSLMEEFPDFTYSQSQGSTYRIIEEHAPDMLEEIKARVHEGRWELAASTWVENDKNMSGGESMARHILYTKAYLADLFDIDPETIRIDFEPDTFGHSAHLPEILQSGGVDYYYHCRGNDSNVLYNWKAPSGRTLLVYRDPVWYGNSVNPNIVLHGPRVCSEAGVNDMLAVYGVGDHGGGPSRRDIEKIREMQEWPLFPRIKFSTHQGFFRAVEDHRDSFPVVEGEQNFVLTGCLTSSSRIKMANRYGEGALYEAEMSSAAGALIEKSVYRKDKLALLWRDVLFNQFHDILPGCGMVFTREYALGKFQDVLAGANMISKASFESLADDIDLSAILPEGILDEGETAKGAGVGILPDRLNGELGLSFNIRHSQVGRGTGPVRVFHLFNGSQYDRRQGVNLMVWDFKGDTEKLSVCGSDHRPLPFAIVKSGYNQYWGHFYTELLIEPEIPPLGYETVYLKEADPKEESVYRYSHRDPRVNKYPVYDLENDFLRAEFDEKTMDLVTLTDKESGLVRFSRLEGVRGGGFRYLRENGRKASAWVVGETLSADDCFREVRDRGKEENPVRQTIGYTLKLASSELKVTVHLDRYDRALTYRVSTVWNEIGTAGVVPQLNYALPVKNTRLICDVPMGLAERSPAPEETGGLTFGLSAEDGSETAGLFMTSESKYAYRADQNTFSLTLLRSTANPDSHPETGTHFFDFQVGWGPLSLARRCGEQLNRSITVVSGGGKGKGGSLPLRRSLFTLNGEGIVLSSVKLAEDGSGDGILRFHNSSHSETLAQAEWPVTVRKAWQVDLNENPLKPKKGLGEAPVIQGNRISLKAPAASVVSLRIKAFS